MKMQKTPVGETSLTGVRLNRIFWHPYLWDESPLAIQPAKIKRQPQCFLMSHNSSAVN
jgi:hypothetical protein